MSRPSPVRPFPSRLSTALTTAPSRSPRVVLPRTARGCLHCVDLRPTAEVRNIFGGDDAHGDTAAQTVTFCGALSGETSPVVDEVGARERRGAGDERRPAVAAPRRADCGCVGSPLCSCRFVGLQALCDVNVVPVSVARRLLIRWPWLASSRTQPIARVSRRQIQRTVPTSLWWVVLAGTDRTVPGQSMTPAVVYQEEEQPGAEVERSGAEEIEQVQTGHRPGQVLGGERREKARNAPNATPTAAGRLWFVRTTSSAANAALTNTGIIRSVHQKPPGQLVVLEVPGEMRRQ
jgi:hypothetical protein